MRILLMITTSVPPLKPVVVRAARKNVFNATSLNGVPYLVLSFVWRVLARSGVDPVLVAHEAELRWAHQNGSLRWVGYLSSTGEQRTQDENDAIPDL